MANDATEPGEARELYLSIASKPMTTGTRIAALNALEQSPSPASIPTLRDLKDALFEAKHLLASRPKSQPAAVQLEIHELEADDAQASRIRRPVRPDGPALDPSVAGVANNPKFALALDRAYIAALAANNDRAAIAAMGVSTDSQELKTFIDETLQRMQQE